MIGNEVDKIINEIFQSLLSRCRICLEESMKGSEFDFDFFYLYSKLQRSDHTCLNQAEENYHINIL